MESVKKYWNELQPRERLILLLGALVVLFFVFYTVIWAPWHKAIFEMQGRLEKQRGDLVWLRQQAEQIGETGGPVQHKRYKGANASLLSIIERSANRAGVRDAIKQVNPRQNKDQVNVVLESVSFNKWVRWSDDLQSEYGVMIVELDAERESEKPDIVEIRVSYEREKK